MVSLTYRFDLQAAGDVPVALLSDDRGEVENRGWLTHVGSLPRTGTVVRVPRATPVRGMVPTDGPKRDGVAE